MPLQRAHFFVLAADRERPGERRDDVVENARRISRHVSAGLVAASKVVGDSEVQAMIERGMAERIRSVHVPSGFSLGVADTLRAHGIGVHAADGSLFPRRWIKTPGEVAHIRNAMRATESGVQAAVDLLRRSRVRGPGTSQRQHQDGGRDERQAQAMGHGTEATGSGRPTAPADRGKPGHTV